MKKELLIGIGIGAVVVALFTGANASSFLFGLLILACPLMMAFMMRGHGPNHEDDHSRGDELVRPK
jgi:Protein of unknown function (DUF2933)